MLRQSGMTHGNAQGFARVFLVLCLTWASFICFLWKTVAYMWKKKTTTTLTGDLSILQPMSCQCLDFSKTKLKLNSHVRLHIMNWQCLFRICHCYKRKWNIGLFCKSHIHSHLERVHWLCPFQYYLRASQRCFQVLLCNQMEGQDCRCESIINSDLHSCTSSSNRNVFFYVRTLHVQTHIT